MFSKRKHRKHSYAQCGEDLLAVFLFKFLGVKGGTFLEIGSHSPIKGNNTYLLREKGWRGVCVEPNPQLHVELKKARKGDNCLNVGVCGEGESRSLDFFIFNRTTLSTFSKTEAERLESEGAAKIEEVIKVPVLPIAELLDQHCGKTPEFVSLDVEGLDEEILRAWPWKRHRPVCICAETIDYDRGGRGEKRKDLIEYVHSQGYSTYADTYINTLFVEEAAFSRRGK